MGEDDAEADQDDAPADDVPDRDAVLAMLGDGMREAHYKITEGRVRNPENARARQGYHSSLAKLANAYRLLAEDKQLDELEEKIEEYEQQQQNDFQIK